MMVLHSTPFVGALLSFLDKDGSEGRTALLKATFEIRSDGLLQIAEEQEPICFTDQHIGDPTSSSMIYPSDGAHRKLATDILVIGGAYAPGGRPTPSFRISLSVGRAQKDIAVFGNRCWTYSRFNGVSMSQPSPCTEVPLCWERAFGGEEPLRSAPDQRQWEKRNPIGTGFRLTKSKESLDGLALPNLEDPENLIQSWEDKPAPQNMGCVGRSWMPRSQYAGTYDEAWQQERMPIPPQDFDDRFFHAATAGLVYPGYLIGGEAVRAFNLSKAAIVEFNLPTMHVTFRGTSRKKTFQAPGLLDTVAFKFDMHRVILVWRYTYTVSLSEPADSVSADITVGQGLGHGQCAVRERTRCQSP